MNQTTQLLSASCVTMLTIASPMAVGSQSNPVQIIRVCCVAQPQSQAESLESLMNAMSLTDEDLSDDRKWIAETYYSGEANSLRTLRLKEGLSQVQLATMIDSKQSYIAKLESNSPPDIQLSTVKKLAKALNVSAQVIANTFYN